MAEFLFVHLPLNLNSYKMKLLMNNQSLQQTKMAGLSQLCCLIVENGSLCYKYTFARIVSYEWCILISTTLHVQFWRIRVNGWFYTRAAESIGILLPTNDSSM